jgi:hypothetical protein
MSNYNLNISTLFSSLSSSSSSSGISGLSSLLSEYYSIRSGSYSKLMKAYYAGVDNSAVTSAYNSAVSSTTSSTSTAADDTSTIKELQNTTDNLTSAAKDLYTTGSKSVFSKTTTTGEDGKTTQSYDTDAIYKSVKSFADSYNSVLEAADKSADSKVQNSVIGMINYTKTESGMLGKLGITIGSDYQLSIDEDTFKSADMSVAKSLFSGTGSYAYTIATKSAMTNSYADLEASQANTYSSTGSYSSTYSSGSIYNSYL